ncbi:TolB family protein [Brevibacillus sp. SYSU BS000544]|uniref:TolB family protein n=1 Tax=Brevibacillus sp. SYSU BS000544 TaxID=3416443 RepID=UPI003CE5B3C4
MKRKSVYGWLAVAVLATSLWNVPAAYANENIGKEVKIKGSSPEPSNTSGIDLSGDYAVWVTNGDTEQGIVVYDRDSGKETKIAADGKKKSMVKVDGKNVVWLEDSKSIYLYNISTEKTTKITSDKAKPVDVDIDGNTIVWTDQRGGNSNIYSYNLKSNTENQITTSNKASDPSVSGSVIVFQDERNSNLDIYYYDTSSNKEGRATTNKYNQSNPSVSNGTIVFEDRREGVSNIYYYDISRKREEQITDSDNDSKNPMVHGNMVIYNQKDDLYFYNVKNEDSGSIESDIYDRITPVIYDEDVLFAMRDDDVTSLYMFNIDDEELTALGGNIGEPSQPDASDKYVTFISEGKKDKVMLYDVATTQIKTISPDSHEPDRPVVSNTYAVWYDKEEEDLFSYNTKTQTVKKATPKSSKPVEDLYEIDGNNLFWVEEDGRDYVLNLTNLSNGSTKKIEDTNDELLKVDIAGDRVMWIEDGKGDHEINYFDFKENEEIETISEKNMDIESPSLSENYIVWTTKVEKTMDLYYYDFEKDRVYSVFDKGKGDQQRPQISRNIILFEDNEFSRNKNDYEYILYDLDEEEYLDVKFSEFAKPTDARLGGNRIVWIDERDKDNTLYMMALAQPQDDGETPGEIQEYTLAEIILDDTIDNIIDSNAPENIIFIFFRGTSKEEKYNLLEFVDNVDRAIELIETVPLDEVIVQVLP